MTDDTAPTSPAVTAMIDDWRAAFEDERRLRMEFGRQINDLQEANTRYLLRARAAEADARRAGAEAMREAGDAMAEEIAKALRVASAGFHLAGENVEGLRRRRLHWTNLPLPSAAEAASPQTEISADGRALILRFAESIQHGDFIHRAWLMEAAKAFCRGDHLPAPKMVAEAASPPAALTGPELADLIGNTMGNAIDLLDRVLARNRWLEAASPAAAPKVGDEVMFCPNCGHVEPAPKP